MAAKKLAAALLTAILQLCSSRNVPEVMPKFLAPLENHTVTQGRDISFTCVVSHLHPYKVAWIKSDSRAILAIHTLMITHNPRLSVTHNGHDTWKLRISNVQKNDSGTYMCQVNTDPMRSQMGHMIVQVPPDIMDDDSTEGYVTRERGAIKLRCVATGIPKPTVTWRREDGRNITLREEGREKISNATFSGETLNLTGVLRQEMGNYLCIASNGVSPTISKRYSVQVHFPPMITVTNQIVGAPVNRNVTLQCIVEASPRAMNTWYRNEEKLLLSPKFTLSEFALNDYTWQMNITVHNLEKKDFGGYTCAAVNALGKAEAVVGLRELELVTVTTPGPILRITNSNIKKKIHGKKKNNRRPYDNHNESDNYLNSVDDLGTTQMMGGSGGSGSTQEGHRTERPVALPSISPPWVILVNKSQNICVSIETIFLLLFATIFLN